jgi:hypothetical protein
MSWFSYAMSMWHLIRLLSSDADEMPNPNVLPFPLFQNYKTLNLYYYFKTGQAYFPIVFSQYNPNVTRRYTHHREDSPVVPALHKDYGFWRDFGFGMVS